MGMFDDLIPQQAKPVSGAGRGMFDDLIPAQASAPDGMLKDAAKSAGAGYLRGVAGIAGLPAAALDTGAWIYDKAGNKLGLISDQEVAGRAAERQSGLGPYEGEGIIHALESASGQTLHKPQTALGRVAETAGEMVPMALGAGGVAARAARVAIPTVTAEVPGQIADRLMPEVAPLARAAGGIVGGVGTAFAQIPRGAKGLVGEALHDFTPAEIERANALVDHAASMPTPVFLSFDEALNQVTNGRASRLSQIARVAANSEGGQALRDMYAARPEQIRAAGQAGVESIAPNAYPADMAALQGRQAARGAVAATPEGQALSESLALNAPRTTAADAGSVIQPGLGRVYDQREGMRAGLAERDYALARGAPADVQVRGAPPEQAAPGWSAPLLEPIKQDIIKQRISAGTPIHEIDPATVDAAASRIAFGHDTDPLKAYENAAAGKVGASAADQGPPVMGQVNAKDALSAIDEQLVSAKGVAKVALMKARKALFSPDGELDATVTGLHNARSAMGDIISQAKRTGADNAAREVLAAQEALDSALGQVPSYDRARAGFEAASRPLEPFNGPLGKVVERDQFNKGFALPSDKTPGAILDGGPSAVRDFLSVAPRDSRLALENHLATKLADSATDASGNFSVDKLVRGMSDHEDILRQMPDVHGRMAEVINARRGLAPVEAGPLGKIAAADPAATGASAQMGSKLVGVGEGDRYHAVVQQATRRMVKQDPRAAETLARDYLGNELQQATRGLRPGSDQYGGAGFRAALDPILPNLKAVVTQLPQGQQRWAGFQKMLDVFEATGWKPAKGSDTAFNMDIQKQLQGATSMAGAVAQTAAGMAAGAAAGGAAGGAGAAYLTLKHALQERHLRYVRGTNITELADLLTNPKNANALAELARAPVNSPKAAGLTLRLTHMAATTAQSPSNPGSVH